MNIADSIQSIGVIATIIFSLIAFIQSLLSKKDSAKAKEIAENSNILSNTANGISKKALNETSKDYMPLIRFVDEVEVTKKSRDTLRNEITFDFEGKLYDADIDEEITCISAKIENIGKGLATKIKIGELFIQEGNKVAIDIRAQEELDTLCYIEKCECEQKFIFNSCEKSIINFIITDNVMERENSDLEWAENRITKFVNEFDNFMISMSVDMKSINNSEYKQEYLWGTYVNKKVVYNSFDKAELK